MIVNNAMSVSQALAQGLHLIRVHGVAKPSRVGDVLVSPRPVMTEYINPRNRVLLSPIRDANPFFHVMETLWMLQGRNDLPWLVRFNSRFSSYSDDGGKTQPGAYGYRWRNYFGHDQLQDAILELRQNPDSRRVVIAMWDGGSRASWCLDGSSVISTEQPGDSYAAALGSADVPCNTHIYFDTTDGRLNMTVCCRSNDIIWGAYGANAVHFSFLLEYISAMTDIPMGVYRQFSNNFHLYTNIVPRDELMVLARDVDTHDPYYRASPTSVTRTEVFPPPRTVPLVKSTSGFDEELSAFNLLTDDDKLLDAAGFSEPFLRDVAVPMFNAYMFKRDKNYDAAIDAAQLIRADDWRQASAEWLRRKQIRKEQNTQRFTDVIEPTENLLGVEDRTDGTA